MKNDINGLIIKIEDILHFFWIFEGKIINPSISIGDSFSEAYKNQKEDYIQFVNMDLKLKPGKTFKLETFDDWERFNFISSKRDGIQIKKDGNETTILEFMRKGDLQDLVDDYFQEKL